MSEKNGGMFSCKNRLNVGRSCQMSCNSSTWLYIDLGQDSGSFIKSYEGLIPLGFELSYHLLYNSFPIAWNIVVPKSFDVLGFFASSFAESFFRGFKISFDFRVSVPVEKKF